MLGPSLPRSMYRWSVRWRFDLVSVWHIVHITCQIAYMTPLSAITCSLDRAMAPPRFHFRDIYRSVFPVCCW